MYSPYKPHVMNVLDLHKRFFIILCSFFFLISCTADEDLFLDAVLNDGNEVDNPAGNDSPEEEAPTEEEIIESDSEILGDISETPCDFNLDNAEAGSTVVIDCRMDLNGQTVNLPNNITLDFDGGEIINGTLNFQSGTIDGRLLNHKLQVTGDASLKSPTFQFFASRWNIVQGPTNSDQAFENRNILENLFDMVLDLNGDTFKMYKFDAYFEVTKVTSTSNPNFYASVEAINVPGNFSLEMSTDTHLRVFPNSRKTYALLAIREVDNASASGGTLHGDRDQHDYSDGGTHEWGYLFFVHGATNSRVSNMKMIDATGDGMKIQDVNFHFDPDHIASENITVTECVFNNNRRNNMSITGGNNLFIENNEFLNASVDTNLSEGVAPGFAIDIEGTRKREANGELVFYERAENIFIRDNVEKNSRAGGFTVAIGYDVTIENNTVETGISFSLAHGTRIIGNRVIAVTDKMKEIGNGIKAGRANVDDETIYNNEIYGNTVEGFGTGIYVTNRDVIVRDNTTENCRIGMNLIKLTNGTIQNNTIRSTREGSLGVSVSSTLMNGVLLSSNDIQVDRNPFKFYQVNTDPASANYDFTVSDNILRSANPTLFLESYGIQFHDNDLDHGIELFNSENIALSGNTLNAPSDHGFHLREVNSAIAISGNTINVSGNKECIKIESTTNSNEVTVSNNNCQE